jgi:hypothetical protein
MLGNPACDVAGHREQVSWDIVRFDVVAGSPIEAAVSDSARRRAFRRVDERQVRTVATVEDVEVAVPVSRVSAPELPSTKSLRSAYTSRGS